jgi:hypothetical protein
MIEYLMPAGALIAGALIYLATYESVKEHMNIQLDKNIFFAIFIIAVLIFGVYITETIQLSERASMNSNAQQTVSVYPCFIQNTAECNSIVNKMNNDNYAAVSAGTINLFIGFSLIDTIIKNVFTYFCAGMLFIWASVSLYSFRKVNV